MAAYSAFSGDSSPAPAAGGGGTTPPNNMPDDMMDGMEMPMTPADTTSPTVTSIVGTRGTGANENQITWVVTFSERVTGIQSAHFVLNPTGGTLGMVADSTGTGTTITITTTHDDTNDGMVTLMFDASGGTSAVQDLATTPNSATADLTAMMAVDIDLTPATNFISHLPTGNTAVTHSRGGTTTRNIARSGDSSRITLDGVSYNFASPTTTGEMLVSDNKQMVISSISQGAHSSFTHFFVGTNVDGLGTGERGFTAAYIHRQVSTRDRQSTFPTATAAVEYEGTYTALIVPSGNGALAEGNGIFTGDVALTANFHSDNAVSGTFTDSSDVQTGTFTATETVGFSGFYAGTFTGENDLSSIVGGVDMSFYGAESAEAAGVIVDIAGTTRGIVSFQATKK